MLVVSDANKNDFIQGAGLLVQNDITWEQANSTAMAPDQKVNKSEYN